MPLTPEETHTWHDPIDWLAAAISQRWSSAHVEEPKIGGRTDIENPDVANDNYIIIYERGGGSRESMGPRHKRRLEVYTLDVRSDKRDTAKAIRDEVERIIDTLLVKPDPHGEWTSAKVVDVTTVADFSAYCQIHVDVELKRSGYRSPLPEHYRK